MHYVSGLDNMGVNKKEYFSKVEEAEARQHDDVDLAGQAERGRDQSLMISTYNIYSL